MFRHRIRLEGQIQEGRPSATGRDREKAPLSALPVRREEIVTAGDSEEGNSRFTSNPGPLTYRNRYPFRMLIVQFRT